MLFLEEVKLFCRDNHDNKTFLVEHRLYIIQILESSLYDL
jgi:hypothetical protein